jgi:hypothetical protein
MTLYRRPNRPIRLSMHFHEEFMRQLPPPMPKPPSVTCTPHGLHTDTFSMGNQQTSDALTDLH